MRLEGMALHGSSRTVCTAPNARSHTCACAAATPADADELAAACGMFISPAKAPQGSGATNKPRKLFLEEAEGKPTSRLAAASTGRPSLPDSQLGDLPGGLSPSLWVQAA